MSFTMSSRSLFRHPPSSLSGCSCQQSAPPKHIQHTSPPERSKRKSISLSLAITLAAGAASVAVIFTALLAVYLLTGHFDSTTISSTTSNSVVSTTTRSTAFARARLLDNAIQASFRGKHASPLVHTYNDNVKDRKLEIPTVTVEDDGAWPKVAWLMSFPK
jgi:hypothetical protein